MFQVITRSTNPDFDPSDTCAFEWILKHSQSAIGVLFLKKILN